MANLNGTSRTNFFKVKDATAFTQAMTDYDVDVLLEDETDDCMTFSLVPTTDGGDWPNFDARTDSNFWIPEIVAAHLVDDEIAVFQTVGVERNSLAGYAIAINNLKETVVVSLNNIYHLAEAKFGVRPSEVIY
jgi:hypothetical protein